MTNQEKKEYIKLTWNQSSGKRITEMLNRYFKSRSEERNNTFVVAKEIFGEKPSI